jgi:hypothetical protein
MDNNDGVIGSAAGARALETACLDCGHTLAQHSGPGGCSADVGDFEDSERLCRCACFVLPRPGLPVGLCEDIARLGRALGLPVDAETADVMLAAITALEGDR